MNPSPLIFAAVLSIPLPLAAVGTGIDAISLNPDGSLAEVTVGVTVLPAGAIADSAAASSAGQFSGFSYAPGTPAPTGTTPPPGAAVADNLLLTGEAGSANSGEGVLALRWGAQGFTDSNFNVNGSNLPGLASKAGPSGGVWNNQNSYGSGIYATRPLASSISFSTTQEIFFSVRLRNHADTAMGVGLADGASGSTAMIGAGFTWNNHTGLGGQNAANAA